jgi:hypothetical protein
MSRTLSQTQKDELRQSFLQHNFSLDAAIEKLVNAGYDEANAKLLIVAEFKEFKKEMFQKKVKGNDQEEIKKVVTFVVIMVSLVGPIFDIVSPLWYIAAVVITGIAGYIGYKPKPIAGLLGCMIVTIAFPFCYMFYFTGRTSYIKIEMVIPLVMAIVPAVLLYFIVSKILYPNTENN